MNMPKKISYVKLKDAVLKTSDTAMSLPVPALRVCAVIALKESRFTLTGTLRLRA
ncbi:MAG: hypothetical protein GX550_04545 [Syntrophomonadaceae bacterium]|nr:hypothetical protein [Syntrophomonadaceae bacterium]